MSTLFPHSPMPITVDTDGITDHWTKSKTGYLKGFGIGVQSNEKLPDELINILVKLLNDDLINNVLDYCSSYTQKCRSCQSAMFPIKDDVVLMICDQCMCERLIKFMMKF